jgi:uroporphyrin-III C-methyltransferase/precorrin-2 dehydrogenase/sirohydrochlorin ferrochelatase
MDYLPIFVDVRERLIVVIGGGAVAARKVELLLKAHARVRVIAPQLHSELGLFRDAGRIEHFAGRFVPAQLEGAALVIAATDDVAVNEAVAGSARTLGIWANVVDDTERSAFIFPAIVDRSPVLVAVGTAGHSPTLARRVRAQIEALLPERLGELAAFAGRWRERVRSALPNPAARLRFWETFFAGPVATQVLAGQSEAAEQTAATELDRARLTAAGEGIRGEVYLIGAGPGDPDLLTLRAQQLLQLADVILHDRLVSPQILARARRDAQRVYVGKAPGDHRNTQERINELLVDYARRGLRVARLKGGDPFIFGRGGEELEVLRQHGIPAVVVPGITAGLGAAASAAIPLTHRGIAQAVTFVTATGAAGEHLNWPALAAPQQTVVFYMSAAQTQHIVARLLAAGAAPELPATIVERATWPDQRVIKSTLAALPGVAQAAELQSPSLLVVGEVAALAATGLVAAGAEFAA